MLTSIENSGGCVDEEVMQSWKSRLPDITAGNATCDIYNKDDESRIFFGPCQIKLSVKKELNVKEEKGQKNGLQSCSVCKHGWRI